MNWELALCVFIALVAVVTFIVCSALVAYAFAQSIERKFGIPEALTICIGKLLGVLIVIAVAVGVFA